MSTKRWRNLKTQQPSVILNLCFRKTGAEKSRDYPDVNALENLRFQNVLRKVGVSNTCGLKGIFGKRRFCDGLVWTLGLTLEIELRFIIYLAQCGRIQRSDVKAMPSISTHPRRKLNKACVKPIPDSMWTFASGSDSEEVDMFPCSHVTVLFVYWSCLAVTERNAFVFQLMKTSNGSCYCSLSTRF